MTTKLEITDANKVISSRIFADIMIYSNTPQSSSPTRTPALRERR